MRKTVFLLFFSLILLAGCVKRAEESPTPAPETPPAPTATATPTPTPSPTPSPTPTPPPFVNGLNGAPSEEDCDVKRPFAVMLNNIEVALPQCGVGQADIIYEILAEGGITRMMGIFYDLSGAGNLGSMRSARPYYLDVAQSYDAIFVHAGGSDQAYYDISSKRIDSIDGVRGWYGARVFFRDPNRMKGGYEHSLFTTSELILGITDELGYSTEHASGSYNYGLSFTRDATPENGFDAESVKVSFGGHKETLFTFDPLSGGYGLSEYSIEYTDGNTNEALRFANVLVLVAKHTTLDSEGRLAVELTGSGEGWFASGGAGCDITWSRDRAGGVFGYTDGDGRPVALAEGKTFICIIPTGSGVSFS